MNFKKLVYKLYEAIDAKFSEQFDFRIRDVTFIKVVHYLHAPKDSSSLAVTRILFGLAMLLDIPDERGGSVLDKRWDPDTCQFPLFPFLRPLPVPYMAVIYAAMWFGALGMTLGYRYRVSCAVFTTLYWYLLLIEKSYWNNHSYLFGLFGLLFTFTQANCYWSLEAHLEPAKCRTTVPYWNYFVLKYQFFIVYFMAGVKKGTAEWLTGYSVQNLSNHWVFEPFRLLLTVEQTDYLIVHWFVFVFDLTVTVWMMWSPTRHVAMLFCAVFNLMNSRMFTIGMFPWVCLATMPLFYPFDWPKTVIGFLKKQAITIRTTKNQLTSMKKKIMCYLKPNNCTELYRNACKTNEEGNTNQEFTISDNNKTYRIRDDYILKKSAPELKEEQNYNDKTIETIDTDCHVNTTNEIENCNQEPESYEVNVCEEKIGASLREKLTTCVIFFYVLTQAFLPFSHFITKGYNNWTDGLYGYSWDMMVHTWDMHTTTVKIVDNVNNKELFMDPSVYTPNDRWSRHGDMVYQYAQCLKDKLVKDRKNALKISQNISIYVDVWCSMNGRFTQRLFDPEADLLKASWSPFEKIPYLMPLIDEALHWRSTLQQLRNEVNSWSEFSDVSFLADFPGYDQVKYIPIELTNVTLTILEGILIYETEVDQSKIGQSYRLTSGNRIKLDTEHFHKVLNIGEKPAYYMYSFVDSRTETNVKDKPKLPIGNELLYRFYKMLNFAKLVFWNVFKIFSMWPLCQ